MMIIPDSVTLKAKSCLSLLVLDTVVNMQEIMKQPPAKAGKKSMYSHDRHIVVS